MSLSVHRTIDTRSIYRRNAIRVVTTQVGMAEPDRKENNHIVHTPLNIFTESYEVGELYDAKNRQFLRAGKLFETPEICVKEQVSQYDYLLDSNTSKRIDKLDVSANIKADFLAGLVTVKGSADYAKTNKEDAARHTMHVILKGKTGTKKVDPSVYSLRETDLLLKGSCATHVITEVRKFHIF